MYDLKEETKVEIEDYFIQQFKAEDISEFSYYLESNGEAAIIDPVRDVNLYQKFIEKRGSKLNYVIETHVHSDFISGHLELNRKMGARIIYGVKADTQLDMVTKVKEGEEIKLGNIKLKVMETPGHTNESISVVLFDYVNTPKCIFTGDCLLLGEAGRPDLSIEANSSIEELAANLYSSIQKIKSLPEEVVIFPAHGMGYHCGFRISQCSSDTIGNQKKTNYAFGDKIFKTDFIKQVEKNIVEPPNYYFQVAKMNRCGYEPLESVINKSTQPIPAKDFIKTLDTDCIVIDTRDPEVALKSFLKGSYILSFKAHFSQYAAKLFTTDQRLYLITDTERVEEAIVRLARVGYENIEGYLEGGWDALDKYCKTNNLSEKLFTSVEHVLDTEVKHVATGGTHKWDKYAALDVREEEEWKATGIIPNSHLIPLPILEKEISYLNAEERRDKKWAVFCKVGGRAACAASILKKYDYDVAYLKGIDYLKQHKVDFEPYTNSTKFSSVILKSN